MQKINELQLAKELIRFPTITTVDAGVMRFLEKKLVLIMECFLLNLRLLN